MSQKHLTRAAATLPVAAFVFASCLLPLSATSITTTDTNNQKEAEVTVIIKFPTGARSYVVSIPPKTNAATKADLIVKKLTREGITAKIDPANDAKIDLPRLPKGTTIEFRGGTTGESQDQVTAACTHCGGFGFGSNLYDPLDAYGAPALFTAGILTDLGELSATLTSQQLDSFGGEGITAALFNLLSPRAAAFGAELTLTGGGVDVNFNPLLTRNVGGVIWGTTSLSDGSYGSLCEPVPEPGTFAMLGLGLLLTWVGRIHWLGAQTGRTQV